MVKYSEVPMGDKSDLDRLTDGQEGREIIIVATWLRPTKLIGLIDLFLALICYFLAEILRSWVHPISDEQREYYYQGLWQICSVEDDVLNRCIVDPDSCEEIEAECAFYNSAYGLWTRIIFTSCFLVAFVSFIAGIIAYSNRERKDWYKYLGWILVLTSLFVLVSLTIFPSGFIRNFPFYTKWFFGLGYGFGWAALCLTLLAGVLFILGHGQNKKKRFVAEKRIRI
ncbi:unnamed protein product [Oikopleura dioica]|uniref:Uncharacterized protein n=1 Tax=Oikopleura dioica TaxID=34765 RepID=E4YH32_OIKDI|nr:unnamed protein product [Oikopleura dioica]